MFATGPIFPPIESEKGNGSLLKPWEEILASRAADSAVLGLGGEVLRTFGAIEQEAQELQKRWEGMPAGAVVAVQIGNDPVWPAVFLSLLRAGLTTLPLGEGVAPPPFVCASLGPGMALER